MCETCERLFKRRKSEREKISDLVGPTDTKKIPPARLQSSTSFEFAGKK